MTVAELFARLGLKIDGKSFSAADKALGAVKGALAGIATYASMRLGWGVVKEVSDAADHLDELAQKTGVPIETLQQLGYAAGFSGVSLDELGSTLGKLARNMDAANRGSKEQASAFRAAGVSIRDSSGKLRSVDAVFGDFADKIASMPDGTAKTALAIRVLGRSGASMIPVLNEGREGLAKLREEFRQSGAQIDGETAEAFANFNDDVDRLGVAWKGLKIQIVTALLPSLKSLVARLSAWVKANRELIISRVTGAIRALVEAVRTLYAVLGPVLRGFYDFIAAAVQAADKLGILKYVLAAVGLVAMKSWLMALWPLALIAAAVGAAIFIVEDLYEAFRGGDSVFRDMYEGAKEWIDEKLGGILRNYEDRLVSLGLIEGRDLVGSDMIARQEARTGRGIARIENMDDFFKSARASREPQTFAEVLNPNLIPSQLDAEADRRAMNAHTRFGLRSGAETVLQNFGLGPAAAQIIPRVPSRSTAGPGAGPTVTIGGVTINAPGADASEVARHVRAELNAQLRAVDAATGGKAVP